MSKKVIAIKNLSYQYEQDLVLNQINLSIDQGDFLGLIGPNGSGKSTLLKLILHLLKIQKGEISLFGEDICQFKQWEKIGFISQKAASFNSGFPATVQEVVVSGMVKKAGLFHFFKAQHRKASQLALEKVAMTDYTNRNISELSGGQQQRVFIARALANQPELLILDEPTVGVDEENVKKFYQLLQSLNQSGVTIVLITHEMDYITEYASRIVSLNHSLIFNGSSEEFAKYKSKELHDIYGCVNEKSFV